MLVAFAARVLIPPGFMPASDRSLSLQICWEDLPSAVLAYLQPSPAGSMDSADTGSMDMASMDMASIDMGSTEEPHHHHQSPSRSEHCIFGTACSAGPIPFLPPTDFTSAQRRSGLAPASIAATVLLVHLPQPRAPPGQLS